MNRFLSPNVWVAVFAVVGAVGILLAVTGTITETSWARTTGFVLISPIIVTGILLVVIGLPILIVANRRYAKRNGDRLDGFHDDSSQSS